MGIFVYTSANKNYIVSITKTKDADYLILSFFGKKNDFTFKNTG